MSRYSSLLSLSTFSEEKLEMLHKKKVIIIGVGGVGQTVATYLITNGIINLTIVDFDKVELSNLNRQILLAEEDVGQYKVDVVKTALSKKNSEAKIEAINAKITEDNTYDIIEGHDVVIDAVDNWPSKLLISKAIKDKKILHLHVGVDGISGQYCLFKNKSLIDVVNSSVISSPKDGVMGPMVGLLSSMATLHLLRYLSGEEVEIDTLFFYSQTTNEIRRMKL